MRVNQKISLHRCTLTIVLAVLIESITILCATVDPASFYQRSYDGSYRHGYNAGDGYNARHRANSANEVIGQYQLQPGGRIENGRYQAGVGGFQPQYGSAYSPFNGAGSGQYAGFGGHGGGSGTFGARSLSGGSPFGSGSLYTPGFNSNAAASYEGPFGGRNLGGEPYEARSLGGGSLGRDASGAGSLGGGPGSRTLGVGLAGDGFGAGGLQGGGGLGSNVGGASLGNRPLSGRSNTGGSPNVPNSSHLGPGSSASRSPIGGSLGVGALDGRSAADGTSALSPTDGRGFPTGNTVDQFELNAYGRSPYPSHTFGSVYGGLPRYATNPAFGTSFGYPRIPLAFVYTTPRPFVTPSVTTPTGDETHRDGSRRTTGGNHAHHRDHDAAGQNTGYRPTGGSLATTPNGLPNQIASSVQNPHTGQQGNRQNDGTYNFGYRAPDVTRQESADGHGNVQGGNHDLPFVAGPSSGFPSAGGSQADPNALGQGTSTVSPVGSTWARDDNGAHGLGDHGRSGHGQNNNGAESRVSNGQARNGGRSQNDQRLLNEASYGFQQTEANSDSGSGLGVNKNTGEPNGFRQEGLHRANGNVGSSGSAGNQGNALTNAGLGGTSGAPLSNTYGQSGEGNFGGSSDYGTQSTTASGPAFSRGNGLTNAGFGINGQNRGVNSGGYGTQLTDGNARSLSGTSSTLNRGNGLANSAFGNNGAGSLSNTYGQSGGGNSEGTSNYGTQMVNGSPSGSSTSSGLGFNRGNGLTSAGFRSNSGGTFSGSPSYDTASANSKGDGYGSYNFSNDGRQARQDGTNRRSYLSDGKQQSLNYRVRPGTSFGESLAAKTAIPK